MTTRCASLLGLLVMICISCKAWACTCSGESVRTARRHADVIFAGRIEEVTLVDAETAYEPRIIVRFSVARVWKGPVTVEDFDRLGKPRERGELHAKPDRELVKRLMAEMNPKRYGLPEECGELTIERDGKRLKKPPEKSPGAGEPARNENVFGHSQTAAHALPRLLGVRCDWQVRAVPSVNPDIVCGEAEIIFAPDRDQWQIETGGVRTYCKDASSRK